MTDITPGAPIAIHRPSLPRLSFPRLRIAASFATVSGLMGNAFNLAYVDPYTSLRRQPPVAFGDDLEGRDPDW